LISGLSLLRPFRADSNSRQAGADLCATTLVAEIFQTPEPALTTYVAFFVMKPDRATSVVMSIVMLLLVSIIIGS